MPQTTRGRMLVDRLRTGNKLCKTRCHLLKASSRLVENMISAQHFICAWFYSDFWYPWFMALDRRGRPTPDCKASLHSSQQDFKALPDWHVFWTDNGASRPLVCPWGSKRAWPWDSQRASANLWSSGACSFCSNLHGGDWYIRWNPSGGAWADIQACGRQRESTATVAPL